MGGRLLEGPTMVGRISGWEEELERFLGPFLVRLGHKARRRMCPLYVSGLIGPGDRKSIQPMAERLARGDYDQLHHFIAAGVWDAGPRSDIKLRPLARKTKRKKTRKNILTSSSPLAIHALKIRLPLRPRSA
jgi:DDE superfamily endonuclease